MIVYAAQELSKKEEVHLKRLSQTMNLKDVRSPERLLDEAALFLHRPIDTAARDQRRHDRRNCTRPEPILADKKVLIVDDDIRNIFAMTSLLEPYDMKILSAETGKAAMEIIAAERRTWTWS